MIGGEGVFRLDDFSVLVFGSEPDRLFTPLLTTKAKYMEMTFFSNRSLVESHSGHLWTNTTLLTVQCLRSCCQQSARVLHQWSSRRLCCPRRSIDMFFGQFPVIGTYTPRPLFVGLTASPTDTTLAFTQRGTSISSELHPGRSWSSSCKHGDHEHRASGAALQQRASWAMSKRIVVGAMRSGSDIHSTSLSHCRF